MILNLKDKLLLPADLRKSAVPLAGGIFREKQFLKANFVNHHGIPCVAIMVNKRIRNAVLGCNLKNDKMISVHFHGKPFNIIVIHAYALTSNAELKGSMKTYKAF